MNPDPNDLKKKGKVHRSLISVLTLEFYEWKTWISQKLFEAIDEVFGDRDNINPPLLINFGTDSTAFGKTGDFTPDSRSQTEGENQVDSTVKDLKNHGKGKKKPKYSLSLEHQNITGMFT